MRFVSQYTNYILNIRPARKRFTEYGVEVEYPDILAEFDSQGWVQSDLDRALQSFQFKGMFQHEDEATPVHPAYRLSVYDTDIQAELQDWDEATKALVEQKLLASRGLGRDYVLVEEAALAPPWPAYDEFPEGADALAMQVLDLGYSPEDVIAYETSKWGQNREEVVTALQSLVEARDAGEIIVT